MVECLDLELAGESLNTKSTKLCRLLRLNRALDEIILNWETLGSSLVLLPGMRNSDLN